MEIILTDHLGQKFQMSNVTAIYTTSLGCTSLLLIVFELQSFIDLCLAFGNGNVQSCCITIAMFTLRLSTFLLNLIVCFPKVMK